VVQIAVVFFFVLKARVRSAFGKVVNWTKKKLTESFRPLAIITGLVGDALRSREELVAENMMLRQQLIVTSRKVDKPRFRPHERGLLVFLSSIVRRWREAVLLVKPDTIVRWHREGFRLLWSRKSKSGAVRRSALAKETIELIERMARENRLGKQNECTAPAALLRYRSGRRPSWNPPLRGRFHSGSWRTSEARYWSLQAHDPGVHASSGKPRPMRRAIMQDIPEEPQHLGV
jgi:hypothetical protein